MIENINDTSVAGIIDPSGIFVFSETHERAWDYGALEQMFFIKEESEILQALEMRFFIIWVDIYERVRFLRIHEINANCHQFLFECIPKGSKRKRMSLLYLHRIPPFPEYLAERKKLFEKK